MNRKWISIISALTLSSFPESTVFANPPNEGGQDPIDQFILACVKRMRVQKVQPQPDFVKEFDRKYTEYCRQRAEAEYKEHGRWFYCEDKKEFRDDTRWDECVTYRVYKQLLTRYGSLEKLPNYSVENHEKAKKFWRKWQKEDGSFYNIFLEEDGGSKENCNGKYVSMIMSLIGCEKRYQSSGYGAAEVDTKRFLDSMARGKMNHGTSLAWVLFGQIDQGKTNYIPVLERGLELGLSRISVHTGMLQGRDAQPTDRAWRDYTTTSETMKGLLRMVAYMGTENLPYRHKRADTLLDKQEWFRKGTISVKRNTAEMMVQCLLESPYRSEELLKALEGHSEVILEGEPEKSHVTGDYASYVIKMFGPYLHWEGYEEAAPRTRFSQGAQSGWRVVVGPFGRCVNLIKKRPEERFGHEDWTYEKFGLRARNAAHEKRKVIDLVPASADEWSQSTNKRGQLVMERNFSLGQEKWQNPHLKIKWSGGDIEIRLNGVLVKRKLGGLPDFGAIHIPEEARKTLKEGKNSLTIRSMGKSDVLEVSAGLIDWP